MSAMLTVHAVAVRLGLSDDTVRGLIKRGALKASKVGHWRIDPTDLDAFIASRANHDPHPAPSALSALPPLAHNPFL